MLRTKEDVVRHADDILRKAINETERKSRCFFIAQLFSKIKEFDQVKYYVQQYLTIKSDSSPAYKLLAQAYEGLGQLDNAVTAYENALKFDPTQPELLLKICDLYCNNSVNFDPEKIKIALDKTQKCFPHHSVIFNLKEKLMSNGTDNDRDEYEKLLSIEMKSRPNDCSVRIKILTLYLETERAELAYRTSCEIENKGLFNRRLEWYECFDTVCEVYMKRYQSKCDYSFYSYWLHALDLVCTLNYSVESRRSLNDCYEPICKFDRILKAASTYNEPNTNFKEMIDHFSSQLSFHLANLIIKKTKEDCDYSSEVQKIQIWSERKAKIGSLLLLSIRNGYSKHNSLSTTMSENNFKLYETRIHQSKARFVEAYYTLISLSRSNNQREKQFIDSINFFTYGQWRNEIYKMFSHIPNMNQASSHFLHSKFYRDIPQKFPSINEINPSLFESFEINYSGNLHNMIWLGLHTLSNIYDFPTRINPSFHTNTFKSLNVTSGNLSSCGIESLNQLDVDSYLYLIVFCKVMSIKKKGSDQPVSLPSLISSNLVTEKEERWWQNVLFINKNSDKVNNSKIYSNDENLEDYQSRLETQKVLEQIRGINLQLPLIIHLARTFTRRSLNEHGNVQDACEKRALYLWDLVLINLKNFNHKMNSPSILSQKGNFFNCDIANMTHSEISSISNEAFMFTGGYYMKCQSFDKALDILKSVRTPDSLFKQAVIHESLSLQDVQELRADEITSELRAKQATLANKARDCLVEALNMIKSSGDKNNSLTNQITEKLQIIDSLLCRIRLDNNEEENNGFAYVSEGSISMGNSDVEETLPQALYSNTSNRTPKPLPTSTPRRKHDYRSSAIATNAVDLIELLTLHQNTNQLKLQRVLETTKLATDRIENIASEQKNMKTLIEDLCNRLGKLETEMATNFSDLKKEMKQKSDLYNMLDDEEYNTEEVLNFNMSNYFPRGGNIPNVPNSAVNYPPPAPAIPATAYFPPYQGSVPFYGQPSFGETQQMADYLRSFAAGQRGNSLTNLPGGLPLQSAIISAQNLTALPHLQIPSVSSPPTKSSTSSQQHTQSQTAPSNVVITTSDALPTNVPTTAPTLFVNIPPEHRLGTTPVSVPAVSQPAVIAPHKFQIPMPSNFKLVEKAPMADPAEDKDIEATLDVSKDSDSCTVITEHDPLPNFKPIIPLPDEVEVKTGEENEIIIFECRAKLYRFVNKEWKERGLGQLKILKSKDKIPHFRILMRREQVHKICANHFIKGDMKLDKAQNSDKSYIWWARDFADEKMEVENFLARFKTVEDGELFKSKFDEARLAMEGTSSASKNVSFATTGSQQNKTVLSPPKLDLSNSDQEKKHGTEPNKISLGGFTFSSQPKITEVIKDKEFDKNIDTKNKPSGLFASFSFGSPKTDDKPQTTLFGFPSKSPSTDSAKEDENKWEGSSKVMDRFRPEAGSWECQACYSRNKPESRICVSCETPHPTKTPEKSQPVNLVTEKKTQQSSGLPSLSSLFKPPQGSWSCDACLVQNKPDVISCVACGTVKPGCTATQQKSIPSQTFSFGIPPSDATTTRPPPASKEPVEPVKPAFGSVETGSGQNIFSFSSPSTGTAPSTNFTFGSAKFNFTIKTPSKGTEEKSPHTTPKSAHKSDADESDNEHYEDDKDHTEGIYFQPVIDLPDKIDVKTGEEDELVLYSQRSKLYRYITDSKEWKERGLGDVKILKHKISGKTRLLMRREPVMKLCLNHYITPDIEMKAKDAKSWIWCAADFSDGEQTIEKFCIRFKTPDIAQKFKSSFDDIKNGSDDVIFISEAKIVSDELKEKALALQLPENFYKYLDSPCCKGCRGCENDSDDQKPQGSPFRDYRSNPTLFIQNSTPGDSQPSPLYFGSKALGSSSGTSNIFGTPSNTISNITASPVTGGILSGNSLFGGGPVKPSVQSTSETSNLQDDKVSTFTPPSSNIPKTQEASKPQSQISTFSFAKTPLTSSSTSSIFSFSPQNSVFNNSGNIFGGKPSANTPPAFGSQTSTPTNTPVFGSQSQTTPLFGSNNTSFVGLGNIFGSPANESSLWSVSSQNPIFGSASSFTETDVSQSATPIFGSLSTSLSSTTQVSKTNIQESKIDQKEVKDDTPSFLNKDSGLSFSSFAAQAAENNTFAGDNSSYKWEGAGLTIFSSKKSETDEKLIKSKENYEGNDKEDDENQEEHDPYFEPIVPLPDKIELKTGEEDEDVVFSERAKLYRSDPVQKEWKERGVGSMKILVHKQHKVYRLLMRREQVHKVVCNHRITPDLNLKPMKSSETSYCWAAMNLSQDCAEPTSELLCVKFKNKDLALQFKNAFEAAQNDSLENSPTKQ